MKIEINYKTTKKELCDLIINEFKKKNNKFKKSVDFKKEDFKIIENLINDQYKTNAINFKFNMSMDEEAVTTILKGDKWDFVLNAELGKIIIIKKN